MADIADSPPDVVDVIVAGRYTDNFEDAESLFFRGEERSVAYRIVARIEAAPWLRLRATTMIAAAPVLAPMFPDEEDGPRPGTTSAGLDRVMNTYAWSTSDAGTLADRFPGDLTFDRTSPDVGTAEREPSFVAFSLSLPYLRVVGIGLLVLGGGATIVLARRRGDELAVDLAIAEKMGVARRTVLAATAVSAVATAVVAGLVGAATAAGLALFMTGRLDPAPELPPGADGAVDWVAAAVAIGVAAAAACLGAVMEHRSAGRRPVGEVMRGAE